VRSCIGYGTPHSLRRRSRTYSAQIRAYAASSGGAKPCRALSRGRPRHSVCLCREPCSPQTDANGSRFGPPVARGRGQNRGSPQPSCDGDVETRRGDASRAARSAVLRAQDARQRGQEAACRLSVSAGRARRRSTGVATPAERADAAAETLAVARAHVVEALKRSAEAHRASARAHERAAQTAENCGHTSAAVRHRDAAAQAREAADRDRVAANAQRQRA
jgi:hypothetical protein